MGAGAEAGAGAAGPGLTGRSASVPESRIGPVQRAGATGENMTPTVPGPVWAPTLGPTR